MSIRHNERIGRLIQGFVWSAVAILFVTALGKILSALGAVDILDEANPLFDPLTHRQVMVSAAAIELLVAYVALRSPRDISSVVLILGLSMIFLVYRLGLWSIGYVAPCDCLGAFTEAIGMSQDTANVIAKAILGYFLVGGIGILAYANLRARSPAIICGAKEKAPS